MIDFDRRMIGQEFGRTTFPTVTADDIINYARAYGDNDPRYAAAPSDAGDAATLVAPPTFVLRLRGRGRMPDDFPFPDRIGLDAGKEITLGEPIRPGDVLSTVSIIRDIYEKTGRSGRMYLLVLRTTVTNQHGKTAAIIDQRMMFR